MLSRDLWFFCILLPVILLPPGSAFGAPAEEPQRAATDLLLPYFEVGLDKSLTTVFDVVNETARPVSIEVEVRSSWGIAIDDLETRLTLAPGEVLATDLASWLVDGRLPGRTLSLEDLLHVQAALGGRASPRTHKYYSSPAGADVLAGSVVIRVAGSRFSPRSRALWGNFFVVSPRHGSAQAETLVDTTPGDEGGMGLCSSHAVRFYEGRGFEAGTEILIWSSTAGRSANDPRYSGPTVGARLRAFDESGDERALVQMYLEPLERIRVGDLGLPADFGWLEIETETGTAVVARYGGADRYSVALEPYCLVSRDPRIDLEKRLDGAVADFPPGPWVDSGQSLTWSYQVTNRSDVMLTAVEVTDTDRALHIRCPDDTLLAGQAMTCTASGVATGCTYQSVGHVAAMTSHGVETRHFSAAHYRVRESSAVDLRIVLGSGGSHLSPGPQLPCGAPLEATFEVRNSGGMPLGEIAVTTDDPAVTVTCPKRFLAIGESMSCAAQGPVSEGQHTLTGRVTALSPCGAPASAQAVAYYRSTCPAEEIRVESFINGVEGGAFPGPSITAGEPLELTHLVSNPGTVDLVSVALTDGAVEIPCPEDALPAGKAMVCTVHGVAEAGPHRLVARVSGISTRAQKVTDEDTSHYQGLLPVEGSGDSRSP